MKKISNFLDNIFFNNKITWKKLVIFAIITAIYTAIINQIPIFANTSLTDIAVTMECWVLFGIIIIFNSKSALDSAAKCFIFFLISQPLIYLIEVPTKGFEIFRYYNFWFKWTILTFPMGYIGYYIKKDKWWGILILLPILILLSLLANTYLSKAIFYFPRHFLTYIFCIITSSIYSVYLFKNKKNRIICFSINSILILFSTIMPLLNPPTYETVVLCSNEKMNIDKNTQIKMTNNKLGELTIKYEDSIEEYVINGKFYHAGKTKIIITNGETKQTYNLIVKDSTYKIKQIN